MLRDWKVRAGHHFSGWEMHDEDFEIDMVLAVVGRAASRVEEQSSSKRNRESQRRGVPKCVEASVLVCECVYAQVDVAADGLPNG